MASRVVHIPIPDGHCGIRLSGLICQIRELGGINAVDTDENGRYLSVTYDPAVTNEEYVLRYLRQKSFEAH